MSVVEPAKDRGTILAEERTDLAYQRTIIAAEIHYGADPDGSFDDRFRIHDLQVL